MDLIFGIVCLTAGGFLLVTYGYILELIATLAVNISDRRRLKRYRRHIERIKRYRS